MPGGPVLVLNAAASSLEFTLYREVSPDNSEVAASGQIESIGTAPRLLARGARNERIADEALDGSARDTRAAFDFLAQWLRAKFGGLRLMGVGHRVVHGGSLHQKPVRVTEQVMKRLRALESLAPLHQPHNLAAIEAAALRFPDVPQLACFDTSFHRGQPAVAALVPLPADIRATGVQRYGFHGLSYEYIASVLPRVAPQVAEGRVIVAHLGRAASMCALRNRRSVDCTLGFSGLDGLCMGTRPGALDPGVVLHLIQGLGKTAREVETLLYEKSGLSGISGLSDDMRDLLASPTLEARLAIDYFVYRAAREIGALAASLGGIDALVFTAGIGEKSADIRRRICAASAWIGIELDEGANTAGGPCISRRGSRVSAWCIPTNEALMIARHAATLLA
jgi:acetate kinase